MKHIKDHPATAWDSRAVMFEDVTLLTFFWAVLCSLWHLSNRDASKQKCSLPSPSNHNTSSSGICMRLGADAKLNAMPRIAPARKYADGCAPVRTLLWCLTCVCVDVRVTFATIWSIIYLRKLKSSQCAAHLASGHHSFPEWYHVPMFASSLEFMFSLTLIRPQGDVWVQSLRTLASSWPGFIKYLCVLDKTYVQRQDKL